MGGLALYQVDPTAPTPGLEFRAVGALSAIKSDSALVLRLADNTAVIWQYPTFVVWDWVEKAACQWKSPPGARELAPGGRGRPMVSLFHSM